ncbi:MAG: WecB/TagA/CpsF family glycosyltransferase [Candidatus Omnitrophica bacterium]|nr:WecB/TagA/CpsF family glycosyltransferase [Candidatus Omnitrophota bacterium]
MKRIDICGVPVSSTNLTNACQAVDSWIQQKKKSYVCVAPVSTVVDCQRDQDYRKVVLGADMVTPDGMPLVWLAKLSGDKFIQRTYGPDFMQAFCDYGRQKGRRHFLYGGEEKTCQQLINVLKQKFPDIEIVGYYSPPYRPAHFQEEQKVIDQINRSQADVLWVGLGSPKQDFWMVEHRDRLDVPVIVGVGAAFDFIAGIKPQAPKWMQKSGLEWFFRLCSEPKRLWKRYLIGNTLFICYLVKDFFRKRFFVKS